MLTVAFLLAGNILPIINYTRSRQLVSALAAAAVVFVLGLIGTREYTYPYSAFLVVSCVLLLIDGLRVASLLNVLLVGYLGLATGLSFIVHPVDRVAAIALSYFAWPLFFYATASKRRVTKKRTLENVLAVVAIVDAAVAVALFKISAVDKAVLNHHPIGGGLAVAMLPLVALARQIGCRPAKLAPILLAFATAVVLSRVRAYYLIFFGTVGLATAVELLSRAFKSRKHLAVAAMVGASTVLAVVLAYQTELGQRAVSTALDFSRVEASLGRRDIENAYVWQLMLSDPVKSLVGYGVGARVEQIAPVESVLGVMTNRYGDIALVNSSVGFHNIWLTVLYSLGWIGLVLYLLFVIQLFRRILRATNLVRSSRMWLLCYATLFLSSLWWRKTLFNGVLEMMALGVALSFRGTPGGAGDSRDGRRTSSAASRTQKCER